MLKLQLVGLALAGMLVPVARGAEAATAHEFRVAKPAIQQALRSKKTEDRVDALRQLQEYPIVEAVKLAFQIGAKDSSREVREAAYETLTTLNDNEEVGKYLLDSLSRQIRRKEVGESSIPLLAVLLSSKNEQIGRDVLALLDKSIDTAPGARVVMVELTDQLGARGREEDVALLVKLSKTKAFANVFGIRRSVVWALVRIDSLAAIDGLIVVLKELRGEAQADAIKYLTSVTGQEFGNDQPAWAKWWDKSRDHFVIPALAARTTELRSISPGTSTYYGLPIYAQRMVFVLDISGSMTGFRLAAAKRELLKAIDGLSSESQFAVVVFNSEVGVWQKKLVPATQAAKEGAAHYINSQVARTNTASYDALETAFHFDAEAIFFLSDGAPQGGKVNSPEDIVDLITAGNHVRRESIYSIGIWAGEPGSPMDVFLRTLAEENHGVYRRVDQ